MRIRGHRAPDRTPTKWRARARTHTAWIAKCFRPAFDPTALPASPPRMRHYPPTLPLPEINLLLINKVLQSPHNIVSIDVNEMFWRVPHGRIKLHSLLKYAEDKSSFHYLLSMLSFAKERQNPGTVSSPTDPSIRQPTRRAVSMTPDCRSSIGHKRCRLAMNGIFIWPSQHRTHSYCIGRSSQSAAL
jgi:hypothetical protein